MLLGFSMLVSEVVTLVCATIVALALIWAGSR